MGGQEPDDGDWDTLVRTTVVLVGRTGNGKSATGNSILGSRKFQSARSLNAVTITCQLESAILESGRLVSVIDTPGLFDSTTPSPQVKQEISKCIELAREGIHALVLVLSARNRFSEEEAAAVDGLMTIFGEEVLKYMVVVFTGGDELEDEGMTLEDYLPVQDEASPLGSLLHKVEHRKLVFNNKTRDAAKREVQSAALLSMVDDVVRCNGGKLYTNALFHEAQALAAATEKQKELEAKLQAAGGPAAAMDEWRAELEALHREQLKTVHDMVEGKLREAAERQLWMLEERLAQEKSAREAAEEHSLKVASDANSQLLRLRQELEEANKRREELQTRFENEIHSRGCSIL